MSVELQKTQETGISSIDKDHRQIIELINLVKCAPIEQRQHILSASVIKALRILLLSHFGREEDLMFAINYPHTTKHITRHSVMISSFDMNMLTYRETGSPDQILEFVSDWFDSHIAIDDTSLASFIHTMRDNKAKMVRANLPKTPTALTARQAGFPSRK